MSTGLYSKGGVPLFDAPSYPIRDKKAILGMSDTGLTISALVNLTTAVGQIQSLFLSSGCAFDAATGILTLPSPISSFDVSFSVNAATASIADTIVGGCLVIPQYSIGGAAFIDYQDTTGVAGTGHFLPVNIPRGGEFNIAGGTIARPGHGTCSYWARKLNPNNLPVRIQFQASRGGFAVDVITLSGRFEISWE